MKGWGLFAVLLIVLLCWEYAPALSGEWIYQDTNWTEGCALARVSPSVVTLKALPRSLTQWTWCEQEGQSITAYHIVNLELHAMVCGLLALVVWTLCGSRLITALATVIFALHPLNLESVAYLSGRSELIAAIGVLGCCAAMQRTHYGAALVMAVVALCGKESGIVALPLALLVTRSPWRWQAVTGMAVLVVALAYQAQFFTQWTQLPAWAFAQSVAVAHLVFLSLIPWGQSLNHDYHTLTFGGRLIAAGGLAGVVVYGLLTSTLGLQWMAVALLPRLIVPVPGALTAEHHWYVPLMGFVLMIATWAGTRRAA